MGEDDDYDERRVRERAIAALIGFVAGDAYGAAVEHGLQPFSSREASRVTDATQLMLATGEGLARAMVRSLNGKMPSLPEMCWHALARWGAGQGDLALGEDARECARATAWLSEQPFMRTRRRHGAAAAKALAVGRNQVASAGCGILARIAPIPLVGSDSEASAAEVARLTHGDPSAEAAARALYSIARRMVADGQNLGNAAATTATNLRLSRDPARYALAEHLRSAVERVGYPIPPSTPAHLATGALVVAVHAASGRTFDVEEAVGAATADRLTDAPIVGAITGLLIGLEFSGTFKSSPAGLGEATPSGVQHVPADWLETLEAREVTERIAADLVRVYTPGYRLDADVSVRYPGW